MERTAASTTAPEQVAPIVSNMPDDTPPVPIGSPAPDFTATDFQGHSVKLSSFRGHPVLLDFWATWCPPCVAGLPHTQKLYEEGKRAGLKVLAVSFEQPDNIRKFLSAKRYTFPTLFDTNHSATNAFKIDPIPTTVVIDSKGTLIAYIVGGDRDSDIKAALAKAGVTVG